MVDYRKLGRYAFYAFAIVMVSGGVGMITDGIRGFLAGTLLISAGLFAFSPIRRIASIPFGDEGNRPQLDALGFKTVIAIVILGSVVGAAIAPPAPPSAEPASSSSGQGAIPDDSTGTEANTQISSSPTAETSESTSIETTVSQTAEASSETAGTGDDVSSTTAIETTVQQTTADGTASGWIVDVVEVIDGDTMDVRYANGTVETIRLLGVDTPETSVIQVAPEEWDGIPDTAEGRDWLANWGDDANVYAEDRLAGEEIYIETDPEADRRGYYGRLLVYVYSSKNADTSFNYRLLRDGYARYYDSTFSKQSSFQETEQTAQSDSIGVWDFTTEPSTTEGNSEDETSAGSLEVANVHEDAEGNDHENENDEYITFRNSGDEPIDIGGWTLSDEADHTYVFPSEFSLESGDTVTVYTGSGSDTDSELYWGSNAAIWNNDGDTIIVVAEDGERVIEYEYS